MNSNQYSELLGRYMFDVAAMSILIFVLYYPRYRHKETAIAAALLNIFIFAVLVVLSTMEFSLTAGFGLFAILAMFTLRSEPIGKSDMAYFFGSISIAVISAINGTSLMFITLLTLSVLLGVYIIDHPKMLKSVSQMTVKIDSVPERFMEQPQAFKELLSQRLGVEILSYRVLDVCYVTEVIRAEVDFKARQ
jgi:Domain of unknown function (DUF4956)